MNEQDSDADAIRHESASGKELRAEAAADLSGLDGLAHQVTQDEGTERAFSGSLWDEKRLANISVSFVPRLCFLLPISLIVARVGLRFGGLWRARRLSPSRTESYLSAARKFIVVPVVPIRGMSLMMVRSQRANATALILPVLPFAPSQIERGTKSLNQRSLVTGAAQRLGAIFAESLAAQGLALVLQSYKSRTACQALAELFGGEISNQKRLA